MEGQTPNLFQDLPVIVAVSADIPSEFLGEIDSFMNSTMMVGHAGREREKRFAKIREHIEATARHWTLSAEELIRFLHLRLKEAELATARQSGFWGRLQNWSTSGKPNYAKLPGHVLSDSLSAVDVDFPKGISREGEFLVRIDLAKALAEGLLAVYNHKKLDGGNHG